MQHTILLLDDELAIGKVGDTFISMFLSAPTEARLDKLYEIQRGAITGMHVFITLIDPHVGRDFSPAAREKAAQIGTDTAPFTIFNLYVVLSGGFRGAAARSALAGVLMLQRKPTPWKVVGSVDEGLDFLKANGHDVDADGVRACAQTLLQPRK